MKAIFQTFKVDRENWTEKAVSNVHYLNILVHISFALVTVKQ